MSFTRVTLTPPPEPITHLEMLARFPDHFKGG
jgi:hypothetical protein